MKADKGLLDPDRYVIVREKGMRPMIFTVDGLAVTGEASESEWAAMKEEMMAAGVRVVDKPPLMAHGLMAFGFFSDVPHHNAPNLPPMVEFSGENSPYLGEVNERTLHYFRTGFVLEPSDVPVYDPFDPGGGPIGVQSVLTDRRLLYWPSDLPYFLLKYGLRIPMHIAKYLERRDYVFSGHPPEYCRVEPWGRTKWWQLDWREVRALKKRGQMPGTESE